MARKSSPLDDGTRRALAARLVHGREVAARALDDFHVDIFLANAAGVTIGEIAAALNERPSTVGDWSLKGKAISQRRGDWPSKIEQT